MKINLLADEKENSLTKDRGSLFLLYVEFDII